MALAPATMVSRRCTQKARSIFLREINDGGLVLLNEVGGEQRLLQYIHMTHTQRQHFKSCGTHRMQYVVGARSCGCIWRCPS